MLKNNQKLLTTILGTEVLDENDTSFVIYNLEKLKNRFKELVSAFPENTHHAIATKACALPALLKLQSESGVGSEAASIEEVYLALDSGITKDKIIFDGPAKTRKELRFCIENQIYINIDSFEELERIITLSPGDDFEAGIRLNPQIGLGQIGITSVAGKESKFGVLIKGNEEKIQKAFENNAWLKGVHVHIGSQGMSVESLVKGTAIVYEFSKQLSGISFFDLGGGLPVVYKEEDQFVSYSEYANLLKEKIPNLFSGALKLKTEFGRSIFADTAIAVSTIEYVKNANQIVCHLGADMFMRRVYHPKDWYHRLSVLDKNGKSITKKNHQYRVVGPLCFGGDILQHEVELPTVVEGDYLVVNDVGAYTLSMWSRHCNRFTPKVIGVEGSEIRLLKQRETREKLFSHWS